MPKRRLDRSPQRGEIHRLLISLGGRLDLGFFKLSVFSQVETDDAAVMFAVRRREAPHDLRIMPRHDRTRLPGEHAKLSMALEHGEHIDNNGKWPPRKVPV